MRYLILGKALEETRDNKKMYKSVEEGMEMGTRRSNSPHKAEMNGEREC